MSLNKRRTAPSRKASRAALTIMGHVSLLLLFILVFTGCATDDIGKMRYDLNMLKADVEKMKKKSESMESEMPGQTREIMKLQEKQNATARTVSDLLIRIQALSSELQALTGRLEEAKHVTEKRTGELRENNKLIIAKLNELEADVMQLKTGLPAAAEEGKTGTAEDATPAAGSGGRSAKSLYTEAYEAFSSGRTDEARKKFRAILKEFPDSEYSDNAQFWIGESYYREGSYGDAILAYEDLLKKYPGSNKAPGAMLKQGLAFYSLNDRETGKIFLEKLIEKYPDSEQAKTAARKIRKTVPPKMK